MRHLDVACGALCDASGRVLIAQRPPGKPLAGAWEFPGGKLGPGESERAALLRELGEELGIEVTDARPLAVHEHAYPGHTVRLSLWLVAGWRGEPRALEAQALKWVPVRELGAEPMLEADQPLVQALMRAVGV